MFKINFSVKFSSYIQFFKFEKEGKIFLLLYLLHLNMFEKINSQLWKKRVYILNMFSLLYNSFFFFLQSLIYSCQIMLQFIHKVLIKLSLHIEY